MDHSSQANRSRMSRRAALRGAAVAGATLAAGLAAGTRAPSVHAQWRPDADLKDRYEAAISRPALHYQVVAHDDAAHLGLGEHVLNSLNASQFSYEEGPDGTLIAVQLYGTGDILGFNDRLWERYQLGEKYGVVDPRTSQPATRNIFYPRATSGGRDLPPTDRQSLWADPSLEALQARGVLILVCHNALVGIANQAVADGRNPDDLTTEQVTAEMMANLIPAAFSVPAGVFELQRLQDRNYRLLVY
jgi:intracellular sulfur oxidation DsrE/DsrF family protein